MLVAAGVVEMVATGDVEREAVPVMPLNVAEIAVEPGAVIAVASPEPLTVAMLEFEEVQVAQDVRFCTALFSSVPWAENGKVIVGAMLCGFDGVTESVVTRDVVSTVEPVMLLYTAVMTVDPVIDPAVASPCALINAIVASDELHVADVVRFTFVLFEYVPQAVNCSVVFGAMLGLPGVTTMDVRVGGARGRAGDPSPTASPAACKRCREQDYYRGYAQSVFHIVPSSFPFAAIVQVQASFEIRSA